MSLGQRCRVPFARSLDPLVNVGQFTGFSLRILSTSVKEPHISLSYQSYQHNSCIESQFRSEGQAAFLIEEWE